LKEIAASPHLVTMTSKEKAIAIRNALPTDGLFDQKNWRIAPEPFFISEKLYEQILDLGPRLQKFYEACNLLYRQSVEGKQPPWISHYLDAGKPESLIQTSRERSLKNALPLVIRPDLLLTDEGFSITELDSVPGGIGLTAWLQSVYGAIQNSSQNASQMIQGFISALEASVQNGNPTDQNIAIVVSDEAKDYRPEMKWLVDQITKIKTQNLKWFTCTPEELQYTDQGVLLKTEKIDLVYRFFELFDLKNIVNTDKLIRSALEGKVRITPPLKPQLEEKLWFALFWFPQLNEFWRRELGDRYLRDLKQHIPFTWILDPAPLPPQAVFPHLEIQDWQQLKKFSQKQRDLILKISGYSELAWGSRGVFLGNDMPSETWSEKIDMAIQSFPTNPFILQRFAHTKQWKHEWFNFETDQMEFLTGRARLCPYFFVKKGKAELGGILTTLCPSDKKLIHGMEDAILTLALPPKS
jgi:hypothetical protein